MQNVEILRGSRVTADEVCWNSAPPSGNRHRLALRRDGIGRANCPADSRIRHARTVFTPDDLMDVAPWGPVAVFRRRHYYLGAVLAKLRLTDTARHARNSRRSSFSLTVNTLNSTTIQKTLAGARRRSIREPKYRRI